MLAFHIVCIFCDVTWACEDLSLLVCLMWDSTLPQAGNVQELIDLS